jgi:riboflavin synthase alpha subunit
VFTGTPFGKAKIMSAHKKFKSLDADLLTQLCKELRNRYGDEVTYDGACVSVASAAYALAD